MTVEPKDDVWDGGGGVYNPYNFRECPVVFGYHCRYGELLEAFECRKCEWEFIGVTYKLYVNLRETP